MRGGRGSYVWEREIEERGLEAHATMEGREDESL